MLTQISQLKEDLKHKKQENKQDKLRLEQFHLETSFLKSQQSDQDRYGSCQFLTDTGLIIITTCRSRRRLENKLEQVNETLSRTLPPNHSAHSVGNPFYSSTPAPAPTRTRYSG